MYKYWGAPLFSLKHSFAEIIISFVHLVSWISWLLSFYSLWPRKKKIISYECISYFITSWCSHLGEYLACLQANNLHHGICHKLCFSFASYWACEFICFCVLEDTGGVRIPCLYTLYSNTIILNCVQILGSSSISFKTLFCSNHNILCLFG